MARRLAQRRLFRDDTDGANLCLGRQGWAAGERILGSGPFVERIVREVPSPPPLWPRPRAQAALPILIAVCAEAWDATPEDLKQGSRRRAVALARAAVSTLAVGRLGLPAAAVARALGVTPAVARRGVNRGPEVLAKRGMAADDVLDRVEEKVAYVPYIPLHMTS